MNLADVYLLFATFLGLGIVFPGFLLAIWLLFPNHVDRASQRYASAPKRALLSGLFWSFILAIPIIGLIAVALPISTILGVGLLLFALAFAGIGAAGIALQMAHQLQRRTGENFSEAKAFLAASVALEMTAALPVIGWLFIMPLTIFMSLGCAAHSLRTPRRQQVVSAENVVNPQPTPITIQID